MPSMYRSEIIGHCARKPELRTAKGHSVCSTSVAHNPTKDGPPIWVKLTFWGKNAESATKVLDKGTVVWATGRAGQDTWTGKDGVEKTEPTINVDAWQALGGRKQQSEASARGYAQPSSGGDVPF